jgi:beta-glucanase (GH16 family)
MIESKHTAMLILAALAMVLCVPCCGGQAGSAEIHQGKAWQGKPWKLVWHDEFDGPDGSQLDPQKWSVITGGSGYGNRELESYTDRPENARLEHGNLVITTRKEDFSGKDGIAREYTSARLETRGHFQMRYGRIEARIKLPSGGQGIWSAFWLLGDDFSTVGWPECGELDIMENVGFEPAKVHGSLHGPGYSGGSPLTGIYELPGKTGSGAGTGAGSGTGLGGRFSDDYHVFAVEWEPKEIRFYVDGTLFETQTADNVPPGKRWVFDHPFYILLNVAVGGYWPGVPDATTVFPSSMKVDYVRVYQKNDGQKEEQKNEMSQKKEASR